MKIAHSQAAFRYTDTLKKTIKAKQEMHVCYEHNCTKIVYIVIV